MMYGRKGTITIVLTFAAALFAGSSYATPKGDSADKIEILGVSADGRGCTIGENGKPNFKVRVNHRRNVIFAVYDDFIAKNSADEAASDCLMKIRVRLPEGKLAYAFKSKITGAAKAFRGDRSLVQTQAELPNKAVEREDIYVKPKNDGTWATKYKTYKGKQAADCEAGEYEISFHVLARVEGNRSKDSWTRIGRTIVEFNETSANDPEALETLFGSCN